MVQLQAPGKLKVFTPANLVEVDFTDSTSITNRTIKTCKYETSEDYYMSLLFEEMLTGKMSLLSRDFIEYFTSGGAFNDGFLSTTKEHKFYFYYKVGKVIKPLPSGKKKFYGLFGDQELKIRNYCKMQQLGNSSTEDLKKIFAYYNSL
jgi:hypothetical protein